MNKISRFLALGFASAFLLIVTVGHAQAAPPEGKGQKVKTVPLARTGQITSYAPGDDGDLQMGVPSPTPRFTDNRDGTVTDKLTGLTWTQDGTQYQIGWGNALTVCNDYSVGELDDWRLPNIRELLSLVDFEQSQPVLPAGHPFTVQTEFDPVVGAGPNYWSSTTNATFDTKHDVYLVDMGTGMISIVNKGSIGYILCVRGGI